MIFWVCCDKGWRFRVQAPEFRRSWLVDWSFAFLRIGSGTAILSMFRISVALNPEPFVVSMFGYGIWRTLGFFS